jgi:hypothetical protein
VGVGILWYIKPPHRARAPRRHYSARAGDAEVPEAACEAGMGDRRLRMWYRCLGSLGAPPTGGPVSAGVRPSCCPIAVRASFLAWGRLSPVDSTESSSTSSLNTRAEEPPGPVCNRLWHDLDFSCARKHEYGWSSLDLTAARSTDYEYRSELTHDLHVAALRSLGGVRAF